MELGFVAAVACLRWLLLDSREPASLVFGALHRADGSSVVEHLRTPWRIRRHDCPRNRTGVLCRWTCCSCGEICNGHIHVNVHKYAARTHTTTYTALTYTCLYTFERTYWHMGEDILRTGAYESNAL